MASFWQVALCSPPFRTFTYSTPDYLPEQAWSIGQRVMVPVGRSLRMGVIVSRSVDFAAESGTVKPLGWPLEQELLLTRDVLDMVHHLALRQMVLEGRILAAVLPRALRTGNSVFNLTESVETLKLSCKDVLQSAPRRLLELGRAWLEGRMRPQALEHGSVGSMKYELLRDPPWDLRPGAKRQLAVLEYLFANGRVSKAALRQILTGDVNRVLADLSRRGLVQAIPQGCRASDEGRISQDSARFFSSHEHHALTEEQTEALNVLQDDLQQSTVQERGLVRLVHGVTGSGKTLLYLRLARFCLAMGRGVMLLAPEVALSAQLWSEVAKEFPESTRHWYHGYLAPGAKLAIFRSLLRGVPQIVVGTRSALFLPMPTLGLVILDEEHDASYKQEEGIVYHAKEVAFFRIRKGGLLVLGSGTPDVKTHYAASQGEIARVTLRHRISQSPTPKICLVDMRQESKSEPLSQKCREELLHVLERGEQAMFLLNRRGFAPLVSCLDCGSAPQCPHCRVGLTYHKGWERLLCHYCGYTLYFPCVCQQCGGSRFLPMGEGTESLEEYLEGLVPPGQGVVRLDRDSTRRKGRLEDILGSFGQGRAQVMVGTQMLSKGHHFPNVTLVTAVDGDIGLNLPDYRASEKTFQLLVQLAGRAGRGDQPGSVLIQTSNPDHPCWQHIRTGDYEGFFARELERRRKFAYPPFVKLGMVRFSYPREWTPGEGLLAKAGEHLHRNGAKLKIRVLGPAPAPLGQLKGRKRFHCLLKAQQWQDIREVYGSLQQTLFKSSPLRISLDLDPVNML
ncbi:MAG TPA: primosomal protein N' [Desulfonatronum sp.]|nr:primosomal protein N' [Desulfonatronum sp.]